MKGLDGVLEDHQLQGRAAAEFGDIEDPGEIGDCGGADEVTRIPESLDADIQFARSR